MSRNGAWVVRAGLAVGVILVRLPTLTEPAWYSDDGFFMSVAWLTSRGMRLYADVYDNSPPGIYWLYRLMLAAGARDNHAVVQVVTMIAVVASVLLTYEIARRMTDAWPAALAASLTGVALSLPVLDGDVFNVEFAGLPFFLGALLLAMAPGDGRAGLATAALSGALLAAAVTFRPSYAVDGLAVLSAVAVHERAVQRFAGLLLGAVVVIAAVVGSLAAGGSLAAYVDTVMPSDHAYLVWANGGSLVPLAIRLVVLGAAAGAALYATRSAGARVLAVWIPAAIAGASLTPRELTHYVHEAVPALAVGISIAAMRIHWRPIGVAASAVGVIAAAEAVLILPAQETSRIQGLAPPPPLRHNYGYADMPDFYLNWFELVYGAKSRAAYDAWFPGQAAKDEAELAAMRGAGGPGAAAPRIVVIGDRPWLYVQGGVMPATPFLATNSSFWRVPWAPSRIDQALAGGCTDFVVDVDGATANWSRLLAAGGFVQVAGTPWPTYRPAAGAGAAADCAGG